MNSIPPRTTLLQVGDSESFYTSFLWGTVGILSLDALELSPQWDSSKGRGNGARQTEREGGVEADRKVPNADSAAGIGLGPRPTAQHGESGEDGSPRKEVPLIGASQWERLINTLEKQVRAWVPRSVCFHERCELVD